MTPEEITKLLNDLADARSLVDALRMEYEATRQAIIPPDIAAALEDLAAEMTPIIEAAQATAAMLEEQAKAIVAQHGATVKGAHLQAVYSAGRVTWDTKRLDGYAAAHQEILPFRKVGEPSVSIRPVKG